MRNIIKIASSVLIFIITLLMFADSASAITRSEYKPVELYIVDLTLDGEEYSPGDNVTGSFTIINSNDFTLNDANYVVSFAEDYIDGDIPKIILEPTDRIDVGEMTARERVSINFSYDIPIIARGESTGIHVNAMLDSGVSLGWDDAHFDLVGESLPRVTADGATIIVDDEDYALTSGPTIDSIDGGSVMIVFSNESNDIDITPKLVIKAQFDNEVVYDSNLEKITIPTSDEFIYDTSLITESLDPGVYLGELYMYDEEGRSRANKIEFRYIIAGQIGTIQGVYTDITALKKGETMPLRLNISGNPPNINPTSGDLAVNLARLEIVAINDKNDDTIGEQKIEINELIGGEYTVDLEVDSTVKNIRVESTLFGENNQILDTDVFMFNNTEEPTTNTALYIVLGLVIAALVIILVKKYKKDVDAGGSSAVISVLILVFLLPIIFFGVSYINIASATWISVYNAVDVNGLETRATPQILTVNSPLSYDVDYYEPGESFNFQVSFNSWACTNTVDYADVWTLGKTTWDTQVETEAAGPYPNLNKLVAPSSLSDTVNRDWWESVGEHVVAEVSPVSGGHAISDITYSPAATSGYVAPMKEGRYVFPFYVRNERWAPGDSYLFALGYRLVSVEIEVREPPIPESTNGVCSSSYDGQVRTPAFMQSTYNANNNSLCSSGRTIDFIADVNGISTWACYGDTNTEVCSTVLNNTSFEAQCDLSSPMPGPGLCLEGYNSSQGEDANQYWWWCRVNPTSGTTNWSSTYDIADIDYYAYWETPTFTGYAADDVVSDAAERVVYDDGSDCDGALWDAYQFCQGAGGSPEYDAGCIDIANSSLSCSSYQFSRAKKAIYLGPDDATETFSVPNGPTSLQSKFCSIAKTPVVTATCGPADGTTDAGSGYPSATACNAGDTDVPFANVYGAGGLVTYSWVCRPPSGNDSPTCVATNASIVSGASCGSANGGSYTDAAFPSASACDAAAGDSVVNYTESVSGSVTTWNWNCSPTSGSDSPVCSATMTTTTTPPSGPASCGSADGQNNIYATFPNALACDDAAGDSVENFATLSDTPTAGDTTWNWNCRPDSAVDSSYDSLNCSVIADTSVPPPGGSNPTVTIIDIDPGVVDAIDETCQIEWQTTSDSIYNCFLNGTVQVTTNAPIGTNTHTTDVQPKNNYSVTCTNDTGSSTSETVGCYLNPTVIEN